MLEVVYRFSLLPSKNRSALPILGAMVCFDAVVGAPFMTGLRVLVVEDEGLIAMVLDDYLRDLGCTVVGPLPNIAMARDALELFAASPWKRALRDAVEFTVGRAH